jgi:hypothetical protein
MNNNMSTSARNKALKMFESAKVAEAYVAMYKKSK